MGIPASKIHASQGSSAARRIAERHSNIEAGASGAGNYRDIETMISGAVMMAREGIALIVKAKSPAATYQVEITLQNGFLNFMHGTEVPVFGKGRMTADEVEAGFAGLDLESALKQAASILRIRLASTMVPGYYGSVTLDFMTEAGSVVMVSAGGKRVLKLSEIYSGKGKSENG